jgi:hypothetical protein
MLLRPDPAAAEGVIAITQPWHGWVAGQRVRVVWEGRRLHGTFANQDAFREALRRAQWVTGTTDLVP